MLIRGLDENAKELWRAGVAAEGLIFPVAAVRLGEEGIAIGNWDHGATDGNNRKQVMLVFIKAPRASK